MFERNKTGEMIVKSRYSPTAKLFIAIGIAAVLVVSAGAVYNFGLKRVGFDPINVVKREQNLQKDIKQLKKERGGLQEALARAQRALQMDQAAYLELERSLKDSAREIVKLREELNFYRNIISPANKKAGLRIQSLNIEPAGSRNLYRYKLVLIQALKHDRPLQGKATFEIAGLQAGKDRTLVFPRQVDKAIRVNFKYFQDIEGQFELPKNFKPERVKVKVSTWGRNTQSVEETYNWPNA